MQCLELIIEPLDFLNWLPVGEAKLIWNGIEVTNQEFHIARS